MKKTLFIKNASLLTVTGFLLRLMGMAWRVWLAARVGDQTLGLFQLVFSVLAVAGVAAGAGLPTAVTRICAGDPTAAPGRLRSSVLCAVGLAFFSALAVALCARPLAAGVLRDPRTVPGLLTGVIALPFMAASGVLRAYLTARRKAWPCAVSLLTEQLVRVAAGYALLTRGPLAPQTACTILFGVDVLAEAVACLLLVIVCAGDLFAPPFPLPKQELWHIAAPLTAGRYLTAALRTVETSRLNALLSAFCGGSAGLQSLGIIKGMALPLLLFPASLLNGVSGLLVPELAEASACRKDLVIRGTVHEALTLTYGFGLVCGFVFGCWGDSLGRLLYHNPGAGRMIVLLAPLTVLFYLDSMAVGLLCGLDQQRFTTVIGTADGLLRLLLMSLTVPRYGLPGFVAVMYASNLFTALAHLIRLCRTARYRPPLYQILPPLLFAGGALWLLSRPLPPAGKHLLSACCTLFLAWWLYRFTDLRPLVARVRPVSPKARAKSLQN